MKLTTALRKITIAASTAAISLSPLAGAQAHAAPSDSGYSGYTPEEAAFLKTVEVKSSPGGIPSGSDGPIQRIFYTASSYATSHPGTNPPGANNFSCKPKKGQNPVVLLPGTNSDGYVSWSMYTPQLRARGYCPFVANFNGLPWLSSFAYTGDIRTTAKATSIFIDRVLRETGAQKVDIIGYSQGGGPLPNYYIQKLGGDKKVGKMIGIAPANHGVGAPAVAKWINEALPGETHKTIEGAADSIHVASYTQQMASSPFMKELYHNGKVTRPGVQYINIE
ncbi:triacylglycerol lipase, partial [Cutibacterium granulosum]|uniref:esterase/lipase family protein n=1 Tax=Cutibacterium granulosum TaxID=33011 RepID=UPI002B22B5B8